MTVRGRLRVAAGVQCRHTLAFVVLHGLEDYPNRTGANICDAPKSSSSPPTQEGPDNIGRPAISRAGASSAVVEVCKSSFYVFLFCVFVRLVYAILGFVTASCRLRKCLRNCFIGDSFAEVTNK